jgi:hypothetical protein
MERQAELFQAAPDEVRRAGLLEPDLRMSVEMTAGVDDLVEDRLRRLREYVELFALDHDFVA